MNARFSVIGRSVAVVVLTLGLAAGVALAEQTPEQRQACLPDAKRLCANALPDEGRAFECMRTQPTRLSYGCRTALGLVPSAAQGKRDAGAETGRAQAPRRAEASSRSVRRNYTLRAPVRRYRAYRSLNPVARANVERMRRCVATNTYPGLCGYLGGMY